jgi:hypothetical protein
VSTPSAEQGAWVIPPAATPEQWSRTAIEDVAGLGGQFIWRGALSLRLKSRPSTERVGGWKIADRGEEGGEPCGRTASPS